MNPSSLAHSAARTAKAATVLLLVFLLPGCRRERADGETLRVGVPSTFSSLDPHERTTVAVLSQLSNVYEALTTLDADLTLRPGLAVSWRVADPLTWLFELRPDVRFHDGRMLTSSDVVFTIRRLRDDRSLLMRSSVAAIAGVEARGPSTVAVTTRSPCSRLPAALSKVLVLPEGSTRESLAARPPGSKWRSRSRRRRRTRGSGPEPSTSSAWGPTTFFPWLVAPDATGSSRARTSSYALSGSTSHR